MLLFPRLLRHIHPPHALFGLIVIWGSLLPSFASVRHLGSSSIPDASNGPIQSKIESLSFCTLVGNPRLYHERIVRTRAILISGYEQYFLYNPQCSSGGKLVWAENDPNEESNPAVSKQLQSLLENKSANQQAGRAQVTLLGRFIAPGPKRFGHMDQFRMKFVIMRIEQARRVSSKTLWPTASRDTSTDQTLRGINKELILNLAGAPAYESVPSEILADTFRFTDINGNVKSKSEFLRTAFSPHSGLVHDTDIEVHISGDSAMVTGTLIKTTNDSSEEQYRYSVRYRRNDETWQIIAAQLTKL